MHFKSMKKKKKKKNPFQNLYNFHMMMGCECFLPFSHWFSFHAFAFLSY